jgi:hypothetical protein
MRTSAPDQAHFLTRERTSEPGYFQRGRRARLVIQPVGPVPTPRRQPGVSPPLGQSGNVFGWQRPCYLLGEGYARTFRELMEETDWDIRDRNYEKCADCMVHSGYEATAVQDAVRHPQSAVGRIAACARWSDGEEIR